LPEENIEFTELRLRTDGALGLTITFQPDPVRNKQWLEKTATPELIATMMEALIAGGGQYYMINRIDGKTEHVWRADETEK